VDPETLFAVPGVTGALSLICSVLTRAGDTVVIGEPSYFLALRIMQDFGLKVVGVPVDKDGLDVDHLEKLLEQGLSPTALYTVPVFHNPTGYTLSHERRVKLVALARKYNFLVLADEVYQLLGFPGADKPPAPLAYYDQAMTHPDSPDAGDGHVLSIGSFSKILAPALRVGWLQGAKPLLKRLYDCGQLDSSGGMNPVNFGIVQKAIDMGLQEQHLAAVRAELGQRAATLSDALRSAAGDALTFEQPQGGYFLWLQLPAGVDSAAFADYAPTKHQVKFLPGTKFGSGPLMKTFIRLSASWYDGGDLAVGAQRLSEALTAFRSAAGGSIPAAVAATGEGATAVPMAVHGQGRLGSLIAQVASGPESQGARMAGFIGHDGVIPADTAVVVDVSSPAGTVALLKSLRASGSKLPLVVGTTGHNLPMAELREYSKTAAVVLCSNFSVGVPLLQSLVAATAGKLPAGWHGELTEVHHVAKKDAPSGTAKTIAGAMAAAGIRGLPAQAGVDPASGSVVSGIPTHAQRLGDTVGTHTVHLAGPGERVEITHTATKREVFALGASRMAAWAKGLSPGVYVR